MLTWSTAHWRTCLGGLLLALATGCDATPAKSWPAWQGFKSAYLSEDGRVIDRSQSDLRTVSEGQSYALFFALLGQDRKTFDLVLKWTENNLAAGDLGKQLPAWIWGKKDDQWGVIDPNSASDADLWIAYSLLEASRVWCHAPYADKARALGKLILAEESAEVDGLGLSILPGKHGFIQNNGVVRLNPSYVPPFMMVRFANAWSDDPRWAKVYLASQKLLLDSGKTGSYPDWVHYNQGQATIPEDDPRGDYDAIRTYLWIGMSHAGEPVTKSLIAQLSPTVSLLLRQQAMPEWIEPASGRASSQAGPAGFQAAVSPLMAAAGATEVARKLAARALKSGKREDWIGYGYYNGALSLFAQGFNDRLYRFGPAGELVLRGKEAASCG